MPVLHGERARFRQIFQNLIDNAIKYMGDGAGQRDSHRMRASGQPKPSFTSATPAWESTRRIRPRCFTFFAAERIQRRRNIAGKGVGLSSVKSIIETYSGNISVESEPGKGSTFKFTINGQFVPARSNLRQAVRYEQTIGMTFGNKRHRTRRDHHPDRG